MTAIVSAQGAHDQTDAEQETVSLADDWLVQPGSSLGTALDALGDDLDSINGDEEQDPAFPQTLTAAKSLPSSFPLHGRSRLEPVFESDEE